MTAASELRQCDPNDTVIAITVAGGRLEQVLFCVSGEQSKE